MRIAERCYYRDGWRAVLARGTERLYLSESDAVPVKLQRVEPHYLWGQVTSEYLWSTWWGVVGGSGLFPNAAFRLVDGARQPVANVRGFVVCPGGARIPVASDPDGRVVLRRVPLGQYVLELGRETIVHDLSPVDHAEGAS